MAKATKNPDKIFNDMVQQEMQGNGRSLAMQQAINRGRALRTPAPAPEYDHPQIADDMKDFRNDTMFNFARDNGMAGNGQGFSSRDYLNAVDLFDKYMKGETNDTSWSDFFDKHGLKPISRSNLEKRYRASWDSDAGKGQGPVPTGEQQAIMQQVAQAQQGGGSAFGPAGDGSANNTTVKQNPEAANNLAYDSMNAPDGSVGQSGTVVNGGGRDDSDYREGGYIYPEENVGGILRQAGLASGLVGIPAAGAAYYADKVLNRPPTVEDVLDDAIKINDKFNKQPRTKQLASKIANAIENQYGSPSRAAIPTATALKAGGLLGAPVAAAAGWGYANRDDQMARIKENFDNEDYYDNYNDFY